MKAAWILGAALSVAAVAQTASTPTSVAGTWNITGEVAGVQVIEACTFTQAADGAITGSCDVQGTKWPTTGTVKDTNVTFSHNGKYNGDDYTIVYHGKMDKGALSGTMDVDPFGVSGTFTAAPATH